MVIPIILGGAAAIAGITGLVKGGQAIVNGSNAKEIMKTAKNMYEEAEEILEMQREKTSEQLERLGELKLQAWSEDIGEFVKLYSKFKHVDLESFASQDSLSPSHSSKLANLAELKLASLKASEVIKGGVSSLGAGALAGVASYGGAMMFASASTGTAIASLSGAAATNATLAWFGGGSLAAGGLGVAGGTLVLGGVVVAPVLAVAGFIMAAKAEENLAQARKTYAEVAAKVEEMGLLVDFMVKVEDLAFRYETFIQKVRKGYAQQLHDLRDVVDRAERHQSRLLLNRIKKLLGRSLTLDFRRLSLADQKQLHHIWLSTQILHTILVHPLLTKEGDLAEDAPLVLEQANQSLLELPENVGAVYG